MLMDCVVEMSRIVANVLFDRPQYRDRQEKDARQSLTHFLHVSPLPM